MKPAEHRETEIGDKLNTSLVSLLDHLAGYPPTTPTIWEGWCVTPVHGGANNLLYRAVSDVDDIAIKFTIRDDRDRAGREYAALLALQHAGLKIAPQPVLLEQHRYPQPVVVMTWLNGVSIDDPPVNEDEWDALVQHFSALHTVIPGSVPVFLQPAVLSMRSIHDGQAIIHEQLARIPEDHQPVRLRKLVGHVSRAHFPTWPAPNLVLCRCDPNTSNFLRRPDTWASIDWENSGWGDPAFDIADLMTHPKYLTVPPDWQEWAIQRYCSLRNDPLLKTRIDIYSQLLLVWWAVRFARTLHEVPRGFDQRLAPRPEDWQVTTQEKYEYYLSRAWATFSEN